MVNGTMLQFFHWYYPSDGSLWNHLKNESKRLAELGITSVWLPPVHKGISGGYSVGYDVYDIYDLGEFDQKGSVRTKYGTKRQLKAAVKAAKEAGLKIYVDIVFNHIGGADEKELIKVIRVDPENRNKTIGEPFDIEAYTKFTFPGRQGKFSNFQWNYTCFSGVDYADNLHEQGVFRIINDYTLEGWEEMVDDEKGNYDYLMYDDIEFRNPYVREELKRYAKWLYKTLQFDGVRLDAVKHISPKFYAEWLYYVRAEIKQDAFAVGEYWAPGQLPLLEKYINATEGKMSLFDASLHHNLHRASKQGKDFDMRTIFNDTLLAANPQLAVTVVDNHDTQPLQSLEAPVEKWFKPIAYALILLREGGYPCVFYPDLYGAHYTDKGRDGNDYEIFLDKCEELNVLLPARMKYAYGIQKDYFDHSNCVGWTREGTDENNGSGCAVLLSNGEEGFKRMDTGKRNAGKVFVDILKNRSEEVTIEPDGCAQFYAPAGSVSLWVAKESL